MSEAMVKRACAKLRSAIGDEAVARLNFTVDLREMLEALEAIQPVLVKAEMRPFDDESPRWLALVIATAYNIVDMVDKLQEARSQAAATMTRMLLPRLAIMKNALSMKVKDAKESVLSLKKGCPTFPHLEQHMTGPLRAEELVCGRESDKERIMVVLLLSAERNIRQEPITILPIFGLAGSGKTTLARIVFSDSRSLEGYNFRVWVHVSPELDFCTLVKQIIVQVEDDSSDVLGMEHIMKRLNRLFNGKKVLLILDDLWEQDPIQLQLLMSMLTFLGDKVDVIVTTCNQAIAKKICTVEPYKLSRLSDDTCWEMIKKSIRFKGGEELEKIGREIASKCWGVPSAALKIARMQDSDPYKMMKRVKLDSTFCLPLSTFELSYMSMPPDLRLCFAYCCQIFSEQHNIVKDDLVHQWIALHLIEPSEMLSATQIAEEHITRLLDMSFLQTAKSDHASAKDDKSGILFTMHDLVHDFLRGFLVCLNYCLAINHHGELDDRYDADMRALRCVGCSRVEFNNDSFSRKKCLRVLELKDSSVKKLPDSVCQLRHLRYLKISEFPGLVTLPESFGHLKNLFHVDLSGCSGLLNLPESFGKLTCLVYANLSGCSGLLNLPESVGKLVNLAHINLSGCSRLAALPESFGDLVNLLHIDLSHCHRLSKILEVLQKLDKVVCLDLSFWSCFEGISGLGGLTSLEHLNLSNPCCHLAQHRSHLQELKDAVGKLTRLRCLNLSMCLNPIFYYHKSQEESLQFITECVKDLSTLEHLDLSHNTFLFDLPESLGDLSTLHTLDLSGCIRLKRAGEIKSLKFIDLRKCRGLEGFSFVVCVDEDAPYRSNIVQLEVVNCQELQISCLENVRSIVEAQRIKMAEKHKLEKLKLSWTLDSLGRVEDRALLGELVPPPNLQCLEVNGYAGTCLPEYLGELTSLQELKIVRCKQLNSLPDTMQKLTSLKDLCIFDCPELEKWCQVEENKKMLAHIPNKNYEEPASTSRQEIEDDDKLGEEVEAA